MHQNVNLKQSDKSLKSQFGSQSFKKSGKKPFDSRYRIMEVEVVLEGVGVGKNGAKV